MVIKKFADEIMAEPKAAIESAMATALDPAASSQQPAAGSQQAAGSGQKGGADEWDGQAIADEQGEVIGTARRVHQVGMYVISDSYGDIVAELEQCLLDDDSRRFLVHDDKGRLAGLILAPHPDKMPARSDVIRADDV
jgi:hypothetical protein